MMAEHMPDRLLRVLQRLAKQRTGDPQVLPTNPLLSYDVFDVPHDRLAFCGVWFLHVCSSSLVPSTY